MKTAYSVVTCRWKVYGRLNYLSVWNHAGVPPELGGCHRYPRVPMYLSNPFFLATRSQDKMNKETIHPSWSTLDIQHFAG